MYSRYIDIVSPIVVYYLLYSLVQLVLRLPHLIPLSIGPPAAGSGYMSPRNPLHVVREHVRLSQSKGVLDTEGIVEEEKKKNEQTRLYEVYMVVEMSSLLASYHRWNV